MASRKRHQRHHPGRSHSDHGANLPAPFRARMRRPPIARPMPPVARSGFENARTHGTFALSSRTTTHNPVHHEFRNHYPPSPFCNLLLARHGPCRDLRCVPSAGPFLPELSATDHHGTPPYLRALLIGSCSALHLRAVHATGPPCVELTCIPPPATSLPAPWKALLFTAGPDPCGGE